MKKLLLCLLLLAPVLSRAELPVVIKNHTPCKIDIRMNVHRDMSGPPYPTCPYIYGICNTETPGLTMAPFQILTFNTFENYPGWNPACSGPVNSPTASLADWDALKFSLVGSVANFPASSSDAVLNPGIPAALAVCASTSSLAFKVVDCQGNLQYLKITWSTITTGMAHHEILFTY